MSPQSEGLQLALPFLGLDTKVILDDNKIVEGGLYSRLCHVPGALDIIVLQQLQVRRLALLVELRQARNHISVLVHPEELLTL